MAQKLAGEFGIYIIIQAIAYGLDYSTFMITRTLGLDVVPANALGKTIALVFAFICHRAFTFREHTGHVVWQAVRWFLGWLAGAIVSTGLLLVLRFYLPEWIAKFLSDTILVFFTFYVVRTAIFKVRKPEAGGGRVGK